MSDRNATELLKRRQSLENPDDDPERIFHMIHC